MHTLNSLKTLIEENAKAETHYQKWNTQFRDDFFKDIYWTYFPSTEKYYFEGNPSFLYEFKDSFDMGRYPVVLVRDGFVGIIDFFLTHPKPTTDLSCIFLIHKKYESLIPKSWKNQVFLYHMKNFAKACSKKKLFIYGFGTDDIFFKSDPKQLVKKIANLTQDYEEIEFFIPQRESIISSHEERLKRRDVLLNKELYREFGIDINIEMDSKTFLRQFKDTDFSFFNIDENKYLFADNYLDHFFSSKGGYSLNEQLESMEDKLCFKLSPFHEVVIEKMQGSKSIFQDYYLPFKLKGIRDSNIYNLYKNRFYRNLFINKF